MNDARDWFSGGSTMFAEYRKKAQRMNTQSRFIGKVFYLDEELQTSLLEIKKLRQVVKQP